MHLSTPLGHLTGPEDPADRRDVRDTARAMPLQGAIVSPAAEALVSYLINSAVVPFQAAKKRIGPAMLGKYRQALSAFLGDLLAAAAKGCWGQRKTNNAALSGVPGGRRAFTDMRTALGAKRLIDELPGYIRLDELKAGMDLDNPYGTTCFRPTQALLSTAESHGVELERLADHFAPSRPRSREQTPRVEARAAKREKGDPTVLMPIRPDDAKGQANLTRMEAINTFLTEPGRVEGIHFGGLRRVFNNADQESFDWQWGGRLYSMPNWTAYEMLKGKTARRCREIRLDGQAVAEVDISAAHLTILHGLLGAPFDPTQDPYGLLGSDRREEVKLWTKKALGACGPFRGEKQLWAVRQAMLSRYPVLNGLEAHGITALDLQYHESEIILAALEVLRDRHGIACLPIHDGLVVPEQAQDLAQGVLVEAFQRYFRDVVRAAPVPTPRVQKVPHGSVFSPERETPATNGLPHLKPWQIEQRPVDA